jgi:phage tail sheath protein FI
VFEPNTPALCAIVPASVDDFLRGLWQQGGLQGTTADDAYFVRFDPAIVRQRESIWAS